MWKISGGITRFSPHDMRK